MRQQPASVSTPALAPGEGSELYLELLKNTLTRRLFERAIDPVAPRRGTLKRVIYDAVRAPLARRGLVLARVVDLPAEAFEQSPPPVVKQAETLIGLKGLENLHQCISTVLRDDVPGDLLEAGVWRGGAAIFMRAVLKCYGDRTRVVWAADSFQGLPKPDSGRHAADADQGFWSDMDWLAVSLEEVQANFARYGLLDDQVRFLAGWFHETLPTAPIEQLALLRLDGDMYGSTMDALSALYPKLSVGGYVIVDDYWLPKCRAAVDDFRATHDITEQIIPVDRAIVYWRRER